MKNVLIAGSSGMIGSLILRECLNSPEINKVTIINRKPSAIKHPKIIEIIHSDFNNFDSVKESFKYINTCYYCVGIYTGQAPKEEFNNITINFTKAFTETLKTNSPQATVCFLSGAGADTTEKSSVLFAKAKGIAENNLLKLNFKQTYIFRPAYIYPVTPRVEPNFTYKVFRFLYKPLSAIFPNAAVTSIKLANKLFTVGLNGNDKVILENKDIRI